LVDFHESHYYLSSLDWSASQFSDAIRGHWLIENRLHWVKDVTLNEDNCIHRGGNAPANWAMVTIFSIFSPDEWYEYSPPSFKIDG
jgi:predicted transposase YbfD/YdcC